MAVSAIVLFAVAIASQSAAGTATPLNASAEPPAQFVSSSAATAPVFDPMTMLDQLARGEPFDPMEMLAELARLPDPTAPGPFAAEAPPPEALEAAAAIDEEIVEEPPAPARQRRGIFQMPLNAWTRVSDRYGSERDGGIIHGGIDLELTTLRRSNVYSACEGRVVFAGYASNYGYHVIGDCGGGWSTLYGHLTTLRVARGQGVSFDTVVGISGSTGKSTGEHLHFEIRRNNAAVDPELYLDFGIPRGTPRSTYRAAAAPAAPPPPPPAAVAPAPPPPPPPIAAAPPVTSYEATPSANAPFAVTRTATPVALPTNGPPSQFGSGTP